MTDSINDITVKTVLAWATADLASTELPAISDHHNTDDAFRRDFKALLEAGERDDAGRVSFLSSILTEEIVAMYTTAENGFSDEDVVFSADSEALLNWLN